MKSYIPLWCKTNFSFLEGASAPEELISQAWEFNLGTITITDRDGVYGMVRAFDWARKLKLKVIVGSQVTIDDGRSLLLLAENRDGYANLCSLLSQGHLRHEKGHPSVSWTEVAGHSQGLAALWRRESIIPPPDKILGTLSEVFSGRLYALAARHRWIDGLERETLHDARRYGLPLVAATEVLYHSPERRDLQDVVTCIRWGVKHSEAGTRLKPNAEHDLKGPEEFRALYADVPDWVDRTFEVAERCSFSLGELEYRYPDETVPQGYTTASWLRELTFRGMKERYPVDTYPLGIPEKVTAQVDKELVLIEKLKYCGYFLTMWEVIQYCKRSGILCQGRGSAANSAVCYCLGVTAVDPVRMDLLFERFLSLERAEPPDIDLDIEHRRREEVIQHVYQKYGRDRAAMVANVVRYRSRSALREVGKVLGVSEVTLDRCSKLLSHHEEGLPGALRDAGLDLEIPLNRSLLELAIELHGFPRHLSIHPGGFLLGSEAISRIVPIENATMENRTVIQWDKTDIETLNLFKVDLLGLGALTHLDYAFRLLKEHKNIDLSLATIPSKDPGVFDMIGKADTVGVFQIESRAQMAMLPKLKPRTYYDIVIEVSLVRPGPITGGMVHPYLRRRAGLEAIDYPHPSLRKVLEKTLGIPLFQEQVMKLAVIAANYTEGEADQLRRDMAAWRQTGRIEQHESVLIERMIMNGIEKNFAERVFKQIKGFGEYGFPESHAASFALIAYATAYLKCHHPDVFACALLNAYPMGFYSPSTIVEDAKHHEVPVLPIDVLHSRWDCTLERVEGSPHLGVRMGLRYLRGLSKKDADRMLAIVDGHLFTSLAEFKDLCRIPIDTWESLAVSGALESFGVHRRLALWAVLDRIQDDPLSDSGFAPEFEEQSQDQDVVWDLESMKLSTHAHIMKQHRAPLEKAGYLEAKAVIQLEAGSMVRYAGLVICRQRPQTAKGVLFLTLEDETGIVNLIVWNTAWLKFRKVILTHQFLGVGGVLQSEDGIVHLVAHNFWVPDEITVHLPALSHDFH